VPGSKIQLSGVDIIHGTPILDIKPFIPAYDTEPDVASVRVPEWISQPPIKRLDVHISETAAKQLHELLPTLNFFHSKEEVLRAIKVFTLDVKLETLSPKP
jgi:hypothetical protein